MHNVAGISSCTTGMLLMGDVDSHLNIYNKISQAIANANTEHKHTKRALTRPAFCYENFCAQMGIAAYVLQANGLSLSVPFEFYLSPSGDSVKLDILIPVDAQAAASMTFHFTDIFIDTFIDRDLNDLPIYVDFLGTIRKP